MNKFFQILITTIVTILIAELLFVVFMLLLTNLKDDQTVYVFLLLFLGIFIPTFIAVFIFRGVKMIADFSEKTIQLLKQGLILSLFLLCCLIAWSFIDVINDHGFADFSMSLVVEDFNSQFRGFVPLAIIIAFLIPFIDKIISAKLIHQEAFPEVSNQAV